MPRLARFLVPTMLFASVAVLPACASRSGENVDQSGDDLTTWEPATAGMPKWATPDRLAKVIDSDDKMTVQIHLKLRDEAAAEAELAAISDPDNERYGQFLTDEQFEAKYAPTDADIALVKGHLEKYGLTIEHVPNNRMFVRASGSTTQVSKAFATRFAQYAVNGSTRRGPVTQPKVPRTFASKISSTLGLSESATYHPHNVRIGGVTQNNVKQAIAAKGKPSPKANDVPANTCSEWFGATLDTTDPQFGQYPAQPTYALCGYGPGQLRNAYRMGATVRKGNDGTGVNIAIVDAFLSPTLLKDAQTFAAQHDPDYPLKESQFSIHQGPGTPQPPDTGWYGEQSLDVEAVHTMAPGANIVYVAAQSPTDVDLVGAINMIIDQKLATIISNSYGSPEGQANDFVVWQSTVTHAGLKGIGVYFASGDSGDENDRLGFPSADFPASLPGVTAVGGTTLALGQTGEILFETGWETGAAFLFTSSSSDGDGGTGDGGTTTSTWFPDAPGFFAFGAGGGTSMVYEQPKWQQGIVPDALANIPGAPARVVPDVGMLGDPMTGFLIGMTGDDGTYAESVTGGTSLACPLFAATMALVEQKAKGPIGFANPRLYKKRATAFRDIVPTKDLQAIALPGGIMTTVGFPGLTINVAPGYDNITGLGAPDGENFLKAMKRE